MLLSLHFCCYLSFLIHSPFSYFIYCTPSVLVPANSLVSSIIVLEHCLIWPFSVWTNIYGPGLKFTPLCFFLLSSLMLSKWAFNFCLIPLLVSRFNLPFAFFLSVILSILCTGFFFFSFWELSTFSRVFSLASEGYLWFLVSELPFWEVQPPCILTQVINIKVHSSFSCKFL